MAGPQGRSRSHLISEMGREVQGESSGFKCSIETAVQFSSPYAIHYFRTLPSFSVTMWVLIHQIIAHRERIHSDTV